MLGSGTTELPLYLQNKIIQQPVNITEVSDYYTLNAKYFINNAGLLKCGKAAAWEGGARVPDIMWMPNYIESHCITRALVH